MVSSALSSFHCLRGKWLALLSLPSMAKRQAAVRLSSLNSALHRCRHRREPSRRRWRLAAGMSTILSRPYGGWAQPSGIFHAAKRGCKTRAPNRSLCDGASALPSHLPLSASLCPSEGHRESSRSHPPWYRNVMHATEPLRRPSCKKDRTEKTSSLSLEPCAIVA